MNRFSTPIRFGLSETSLGLMLVAASTRGICAIFLGDNPGSLVQELRKRFPGEDVFPASDDDASFSQLLDGTAQLVEHPETNFEYPLDIRGTAFQQRVWQALRELPPGKPASYTDLARFIGTPRAARAVANACAANFLAVLIPCHRVVHGDGSLSGYRWGIERKRALLEREVQGGGESAKMPG
jgi:AraC family transcriptional regulator of adaptative response/methylated-DNA-[protein]-cysteine methyltransferase